MVFDKWVTEITNYSEKSRQKEAIGYARKHSSEEMIEVLCQVAIETLDHEVRCAILDILKTKHLETASGIFAHYAERGVERERKWALVNLSIIECKTQRSIVLKGLKDPSVQVRRSAALNAGLYQDDDFLKEIITYFETNRHDFLHELAFRASERIIRAIKIK
jgi:HEAT repeat protein